jgi:hypothetical protein
MTDELGDFVDVNVRNSLVDRRVQEVADELGQVRNALAVKMVEQGLTPADGWSIGYRTEREEDGGVIYTLVPVRGARVGEMPDEMRLDLGIRLRLPATYIRNAL